MTDDIVERLRGHRHMGKLAREAADEIEQLREKVERLESRGITGMQHEIARLRAELGEIGSCDCLSPFHCRDNDIPCVTCVARRALEETK